MVKDSITRFLVDSVLDGESSGLEDKTPLLELRILDSFSIVSMCTFLEAEFKIRVPLETLSVDHFTDIDSIADFVLRSKI